MRGEEGFTLVELLAAMVVGTLLLASLGWYTGALGRDLRRDPDAAGVAAIGQVSPILTSMIERAQPVRDGGGIYEGEPDHLLLRVPPPEVLANAGPLDLSLNVKQEAGGTSLDLRATRQDGPPLASRLVKGMRDISFSYVLRDRPGDLPQLITIRFTGKDGSIRDLAIEPRLTGGGACVFDPISMACR